MDLKNFKLMPFYDLDKKWAVLTSGDKEKFNQMTVSWVALELYGISL